MKKLKSWYSGVFRSQAENDEFAGKGRPSVVHPRHASRWQTCDDQLSIRAGRQQRGSKKSARSKMDTKEFFTEYGEANRYAIKEVIGKGSYGVVCSAVDIKTGEKVAIKKIHNVFDHVSDATRILREIKLLRLLRHPDIVEIKHIMLPPSPREFKDIYVVFELMETDLHQVIKANDDLTPEHHQFFLYQMLRGLKYIHTAKVFHRDLKPKNILANADCKLKVCDFGLARPSFNDMPTTIFWTDYVATRWYRAPELCGSFFAKYSTAIDIWSIGCIFAEILLGKPLFPGRNVVHQLELITDLLGTPSPEVIAKVRNEKARRFLMNMRRKPGVNLEQYFPRADRGALRLLKRMLAFDPAERPSSEEALADPYFAGLSQPGREPSAQPVSKLSFDFERRKLSTDEVRELIYREILEYHPHMLADYVSNKQQTSFVYPSAVDNFKRQFAHLEGGGVPGRMPGHNGNLGQATSLPRERVKDFQTEAQRYVPQVWDRQGARAAVESIGSGVGKMSVVEGNGYPRPPTAEMARQQNLLRSNSFQ
ncbi:Mitogen-activated protein kinase 15 [Coccomyxa sp. Obi]|nr:Mitogen-activated protein kinase 15 [Coccomyxa sp. Obi]